MSYEKTRRISYGDEDSEIGQAVFIPVCSKCGRFVKADEIIGFSSLIDGTSETNSTCKKCGRTEMLFEGFF